MKFDLLEKIILEYNSKFNLISHNDSKIIQIRHFQDSLYVAHLFKDMFHRNIKNAIDVGSGAGFPGIPIAILFPDIKVTLLDSNRKRLTFLDSILRKRLDMRNVECVWGRSENIAHRNEFRECYDVSITRALAKLPVALELNLPFVRVGGTSFFWIGNESILEEDSNKCANKFGGEFSRGEKYSILCDPAGYTRSILAFEKYAPTSERYPRRTSAMAR
ncbi:MAG: 16S rRNA (guanine(527)-N(7))-methyltransferase RsmG [Elusimicrobia bacterium]|nr:16S rRNA (guanine(527)-N(7))-methyltransferase RsmG [Elusimicrobiota bacterium]